MEYLIVIEVTLRHFCFDIVDHVTLPIGKILCRSRVDLIMLYVVTCELY